MFDNIDKEKNRRNAIIGIILIIIPIILYAYNSSLKLPHVEDIVNVSINNDKEEVNIKYTKEIERIHELLNKAHGKYLVMSNDGTKVKERVVLNLKKSKSYIINFRDATIEYNGHLYDINPDEYQNIISEFNKLYQE